MGFHHSGDAAGRSPSRGRRRFWAVRFVIGACVLLAALPPAGSAQETKFDEYLVKAAFIHNFVKFVEWPKSAPRGGAVPKAFCIFGADPFGPNGRVVLGGTSQGTEPPATRIGSLEEARDCRILFVASSEKMRFADVVAAVADAPVLTIADSEGGARQGVMVNFYLEEEMVRFEINVEAMRRAGLKASAKLLKLARIVN